MNAPDKLKETKQGAIPVQLPLVVLPPEMTQAGALNLLANAGAAFEAIFPPESAAEAVEQATTTPQQRAEATVRKFKRQGVTFPEGTAGALLCGVQSPEEAERLANEQAFAIDQDEASALAETDAVKARRIADGEQGTFWGVSPQREIRVSTISSGDIEIEEISPLGTDDDTRIIVADSNAVRLARCILFAAGFQNILIATGGPGGYQDVSDGATADLFDAERV